MKRLLLLGIAAWSLPAAAADSPSIFTKQVVGVSGWPLGLLSETTLQYRVPGTRSESIVFQDTSFSFGARLQVSPAFVDIGPMISLAPIDIFDVDLWATWTGYAGPFSPLPFDSTSGKYQAERDIRADNGENIMVSKFEATISPSIKLKLGPIIAFDNVAISRIHATPQDGVTSEFWYESYRDVIVAWDDTLVEHQGAIIGEFMDGDEKPLFWAGAYARNRFAVESKDNYTNVGGILVVKPVPKEVVPAIVVQALFYVVDDSNPLRVGGGPNLNVALVWNFDTELTPQDAVQ